MSNYVDEYTTNKNAKIFFSAYGDTISFSPFLESFSFETDIASEEIESAFGKIYKTQKVNKQVFKISFNVPSVDWEEARENHRKFGALIRFNLQDISDVRGGSAGQQGLLVRFSNLIHNLSPNTSNVFKKNEAVFFTVNTISYNPDLDLGFFDKGGILFAKNFQLSLELILTGGFDKLKKLHKRHIDSSYSDPTKKGLRKYSPGRLFGFKTPYGEDT